MKSAVSLRMPPPARGSVTQENKADRALLRLSVVLDARSQRAHRPAIQPKVCRVRTGKTPNPQNGNIDQASPLRRS